MNNIKIFFSSIVLFSLSHFLGAQSTEKVDSLGLPGDNLNLYVVLDLFQESETLEDFEKKLNQESLKINNLDLNNDDKIDYLKVIDNQTGDAHVIVIQTPISDSETQDVAVIEVDKDKNGKILVQVIGNEELYGKDYIIEPKDNDEETASTPNKVVNSDTSKNAVGTTVINNTTNNYYNTNTPSAEVNKIYVAVNYWPSVRYIYGPSYVIYRSAWRWNNYPGWWAPWRPWYWRSYYHHHYHHYKYHYNHYHKYGAYRSAAAHKYYGQRTSNSITVKKYKMQGTYKKVYKKDGDNKVKNPAYKPKSNLPSKQTPVKKINKGNNDSKPKNQAPIKKNNISPTIKKQPVKKQPSKKMNSIKSSPTKHGGNKRK
jgi:hypothetical protein